MVLLFQSHPNARKVDGTVKRVCENQRESVVFNFIFRKILVTRCLRAGLGSKMSRPPALGGELERGDILHLLFIHIFLGTCIGPGKQRAGKLLFALGEL